MNIETAIQNRLQELSDLRYLDINWGQLDDYDNAPPVQWPCVLFDIENIDYSNIGIDFNKNPQNRQIGNISLTVSVANIRLSNTSANASQNQKNNAWKILLLLEKVHQKLHGWRPTNNCGKLTRTSRRRIRRNDGIQLYEFTYTATASNV